jgi:16S rRNA processing protein RimM
MFRKKEIAEGYSFTVDFMLIDKSYGEVGIIQDILQLPANDVAQVFIDEKEVLLPLNDSTVIEINKRKKQVLVKLPDGIINMYLSL